MKVIGYTREWLKFHAPNTGGASGGAASGGAGNGQQQQQTQPPEDPFAAISTDDMDDAQLAAFNAAKEKFATLQKTATENEKLARQHQAERDRITAEHNKLIKGQQQHQQQRPQTTEERVYTQLVEKGVEPAVAKAQANTLAGILDAERQQIQQQLGQQFAPVASLALQNQAEGAFNAAQATDHLGWTSIPEVKQLVWESALALVQNGQQADVATIRNLAFMHYGAYTEANPQVFATLQNGANQPNNGMNQPYVRPTVPGGGQQISTGFNYPGANFQARQVNVPDPNAPRTVMNAPTHAAMEQVKAVWQNQGYKPRG